MVLTTLKGQSATPKNKFPVAKISDVFFFFIIIKYKITSKKSMLVWLQQKF